MAKKSTALVAATPPLPATKRKLLLSELLPGAMYESQRQRIADTGKVSSGQRELRIKTRQLADGTDYEVLAVAAVARNPGRSQSYLEAVDDYERVSGNRKTRIELLWQVYKNEGLVNTAINKIASVMSSGGAFKVRKARKGKSRKAVGDLLTILTHFHENVNASGKDAVITGSRGLKAVMQQASRQGLVEGSWLGRSVWSSTEISGLGRFDLPMVLQSISTAQVEVQKDVENLGIDLFVWKPDSIAIQKIRQARSGGAKLSPQAKKLIRKFFTPQMLRDLVDEGQVELDPALLLHVKHRGSDLEPFGESLITSAMSSIAYLRALSALDTVTMQSIINRITLVLMGSEDPNSPYSDEDTVQERTELMQSFFEDEPGANMTIIWAGRDVEVKSVGAQDAVMDIDDRYRLAIGMTKMALGVPDALLSGTADEGKAAGWAALLGLGAQFEEMQSSFALSWKTLGERIAFENGFTDVELIYEFDHSVFADRMALMSQTRSDYVAGLLSTSTTLRARNLDPEAEFFQRCFEAGLDPNNTSWDQAFLPRQGLQGQGEGKTPGEGRDPKQGNPDQHDSPENQEDRTPEENQ